MEIGLGRLGRSPQEFWNMTPKELEAAVAGAIGIGSAPLSRRNLEGLMARFPDTGMETD